MGHLRRRGSLKDMHYLSAMRPLGLSGSGSYENGSSFKVVPMKEKTQTSLMQSKSFGEREGLANETS
jgi:hypothetical protein